MSAAGAIDAHSLASVIVPSIFFIWSFVFISLIIFTSAQAVNGNMMVSGMHSMRKMHVAREKRMTASVCSSIARELLAYIPSLLALVCADETEHKPHV